MGDDDGPNDLMNDGLNVNTSSFSAAPSSCVSRATSPNIVEEIHSPNTRYRTFPYFSYLPYSVENGAERLANLEKIIENLFIAVKAQDFDIAILWTRELKSWISLKFVMPKSIRSKLVSLYYDLSLAPGIESNATERFTSMFLLLTHKKHYLSLQDGMILDWRPLLRELKKGLLPEEDITIRGAIEKDVPNLMRIAGSAQMFFPASELPELLETLLPYVSFCLNIALMIISSLSPTFLTHLLSLAL